MNVQNPAVAQIVAQLAKGSRRPVQDGTLRQSIDPYTYDEYGSNFESVPGPGKFDQPHPEAGTGPNLSLGQTPLMTVRPGAPPRTSPEEMEGRDFGAERIPHTMAEKGAGVLTTDPTAIIDMLLSMGIPEELVQGVLREMGYQP